MEQDIPPVVEQAKKEAPVPDTYEDDEKIVPPAYRLPYNIFQPDKTLKLPKKLTEISGLSLSPDQQKLIAINDEQGIVFFINKVTGKIDKELKFKKRGDYEGIEAVDTSVYVVKSNGNILRITDTGKKKPEVKVFHTKLNSKYNVEGLAYDRSNRELLLACKGKPGEDEQLKGTRSIYKFDLREEELFNQPIYSISRKEIGNYLKKKNVAEELVDIFSSNFDSNSFGPSGIAIHPLTGEIYIISSVGKLLLILSDSGEIKFIEKLDPQIFMQPEGICFDTDGTMYISTEGKNKRGKIYRFYQN